MRVNISILFECYVSFSQTVIIHRVIDIIARDDFLGICDQKRSYEHVSDFGQSLSYGAMKFKIEG